MSSSAFIKIKLCITEHFFPAKDIFYYYRCNCSVTQNSTQSICGCDVCGCDVYLCGYTCIYLLAAYRMGDCFRPLNAFYCPVLHNSNHRIIGVQAVNSLTFFVTNFPFELRFFFYSKTERTSNKNHLNLFKEHVFKRERERERKKSETCDEGRAQNDIKIKYRMRALTY